jgi:hypothetical protein
MVRRMKSREYYVKKGIEDASNRAPPSPVIHSKDSPPKVPRDDSTTRVPAPPQSALPRYGIIYDGKIIESSKQLTGSLVRYWARRAWDQVHRLNPSRGVMPENWEGVFVIGAAFRLLIEEGLTHDD